MPDPDPNATPVITIGLPVYNGEEFLAQALDSILAQDYENFEVVISDNASTDRSESICREFAKKDPRVRYFRSDRNRGAAWNYNEVVRLAKGHYFKWSPHDDVHAPHCLRLCLEALQNAPSSVILAYPKTVLIDASGKEIERYDDRLDIRGTDPLDRFCHVAKYLSLCNPVLGLMKIDSLRTTGLIRAFRGADVVLLAELSLLGEFREVPEYLFFRRRHVAASLLRKPTRREVATWYGQKTSALIALPVSLRLVYEHIKLLLNSDLSLGKRLWGSVRYTWTHTSRRLRVRGGRIKQNIAKQFRSQGPAKSG